jgi:hypothetical protein
MPFAVSRNERLILGLLVLLLVLGLIGLLVI